MMRDESRAMALLFVVVVLAASTMVFFRIDRGCELFAKHANHIIVLYRQVHKMLESTD